MGVTPLFCSLLCHLGLNLMLRLISLLCTQTLVLMISMNVESKKKQVTTLKLRGSRIGREGRTSTTWVVKDEKESPRKKKKEAMVWWKRVYHLWGRFRCFFSFAGEWVCCLSSRSLPFKGLIIFGSPGFTTAKVLLCGCSKKKRFFYVL